MTVLRRDNARAWNHRSIGLCGNRWNPIIMSATAQKPLSKKIIIDFPRTVGAMKIEDLREQAERCRRLARGADPFTMKRLLDLAAEYEARIIEAEKGYRPSAATRSLGSEP